MSQGLQITVSANVEGNYTGANAIDAVAAGINLKQSIPYTTGAGAFQADLLYTQAISLAASATESLDLASLVDPLGNAVVFARVKSITVFADPANVNDIVLGGAGTNAFLGPLGSTTDVVHTQPNGQTEMATPSAAGWPVNASTAHLLKVANGGSGSGVTGQIVIIGCAE
jgi:hypothetical protein